MHSFVPFEGHIERTAQESTPWWPEPDVPPAGTPNVVVILLDDTGFSHLSSYGSVIPTPNFDRLANRGLRYTNFHTTALCSPTRACLLTGRNHHSVGMRALSNFDTGFPNMRGRITPAAATIAEVLQPKGYSTFCVGKWHLAPMREASAVGPFSDWPLMRGFDRFYGFMQGETDQFHPELYEDNRLVAPPRTPAEGYHLSEDLVDQSIKMVRTHESLVPERPFLLYLAFGATHAPHQAPDEYLAKWRGAFDEGWDVWRQRVYQRQLDMGILPPGTELAPLNPGVKPWDELTRDEQRLACRLQEAFAAMLDHTDAQVGRLLDELDRLGVTDNTMVVATSDNGASPEGRAHGVLDTFRYFNGIDQSVEEGINRIEAIGTRWSNTNYPWGWAQVGNTPGKRYKQNTHGGGVRDPLIISWPNGIDASAAGQIRQQFHHVIDLAPTILEVLGVEMPASVKGVEQMPVHGTSLAYTFHPVAVDRQEVPTRKASQYFEMNGHRAIWSNGWKAVSFHQEGDDIDADVWELYNLDEDFSECHDLAESHPDRLADMIRLFWAEAERYGVLPIQDGMSGLFAGRPTPGTPKARDRFVYRPPIPRIPPDAGPSFGSRSWTATFDITRQSADQVGVLAAMGTVNNGFVIYLEPGGHLVYDHNAFSDHTVIRSSLPVPVGDSTLRVEHTRVSRGPALARLFVGSELVGKGVIPLVPAMISPIGLDLGCNPTGVSDAYEAPFTFGGQLHRVEIDTVRALSQDQEQALEALAAEATQ